MALVTFYAISEATVNEHTKTDMRVSSAQSETVSAELATELAMAADLLSEYVVSRKKVTVLCASQAQAESFDDLIWRFPANKFIPHNLYGEGPDMGTPVEIIWPSAFLSMSKLRNTAVVINLSQQFIENINNIKHIIDFVPVDENEKAKARERYQKYKQAGCQLEYKSA
jgi:DNA polymerase-3 subunit chi